MARLLKVCIISVCSFYGVMTTSTMTEPNGYVNIEKEKDRDESATTSSPEQRQGCPREVLMWENLPVSAGIFTLGLWFFYLTGCDKFTVLALLSRAAFFGILANFLYVYGMWAYCHFYTKKPFVNPHQQRVGECDWSISKERVSDVCGKMSDRVNQHLVQLKDIILVKDIGLTLKALITLFMMSKVLNWFTLHTIAIMAFVYAFTVPKLYVMFRPQVDPILKNTVFRVKDIANDKIPKAEQAKVSAPKTD